MGRLAWIAIVLLTAYLVFVGGAWLGPYVLELRVTSVILAATVFAIWAAVARRRPEWRPRSAMLPAIGACLASLAISTAFSRVPRVSAEYLGYGVLLAGLYLLLVRLMADPFFRARLIQLATVFFLLIAGAYISVVFYLWMSWWGLIGHLAAPPMRPQFASLAWGNPSAVLTMVVLLAVPTAARFASWSRRGVAFFAAIALITAVVAFISASRSGWLGLGVAGVVGAIAFVVDPVRRARVFKAIDAKRGQPGSWRRLAGLAIGGGLVIALAVAIGPFVLTRLAGGGEDARASFYIAALRIFASSPIVGSGPGTWVIQRAAYTTADQYDQYIPHAHDVPLQTLAEQGLVGAVAGIVLIVNLGWLIRSGARSGDESLRGWAWLTGLGLLYLGVHDLLDFYPNMLAVLFAGALPVAYLDAAAQRGPSRYAEAIPVRLRRAAAMLAGAGVAIALIAGVGWEVPTSQLNAAVAAADGGRWADAIEPARAAVEGEPGVDVAQLTLGLAAAHVADHLTATAAFRTVADRDDLPEAWLDLAAQEVDLGRRDEAEADLDRALRLGIQRVEVSVPAGGLALDIGNEPLALSAFAAAVGGQPTLAGDPWWNLGGARRTALLEMVIDRVIVERPGIAWQVALSAGDLTRARSLVPTANRPDLAADVVGSWSGDRLDRDRLLARCSSEPLDVDLILWCARVEDRSGDTAAADNFREEAEIVQSGSSVSSLNLRITEGPLAGSGPEAAYIWPVFTYRVWGPKDLLVPALLHLRFESASKIGA